jgi:transposase
MFDMLKLVSSILLSFYHHIKSTSSFQHAIVVSLLSERYSVHQIQFKSGIGKSTVGRIKKEVESDKENSKGGHPSKLSHHDKQSIICQITTGKLDNPVQATQFINNILPSPVTPQTVRNALKSNDFRSVIKQKHLLLKKAHREDHLKFAWYHENWTIEDWKRVLWSDETKINRIGSDWRVYTWKKKENHCLHTNCQAWRRK